MHHSLKIHENIPRLWLLPLLVFMLAVGAAAKCPTANVTLKGTVSNLPSGVSGLELISTVETPKGNSSKRVPLSNSDFTVTVPFSTRSSSFMGGDRCHNTPTLVEVRIASPEKVYVQKSLPFKDNFETYGSYLYRLKHELPLDVKADSK
jgi:hypothetical protein